MIGTVLEDDAPTDAICGDFCGADRRRPVLAVPARPIPGVPRGRPPCRDLVIDAGFVPKSGKHTYGLDRFWNGSHSRTEKGLEISTLAWLDLTGNYAYSLSVEQTPPNADPLDPEATRLDVYLESKGKLDICYRQSDNVSG